ncbi:MAG TPA: uroporphyrinogen-III synthase [Rugosimonospora sp.]|nr:uroporphyrinogen-III synthase [Rugosimonospora sp.]
MDDTDPLRGFTVAVTADRRREELAGLLDRRGARVVLAPALRIVPLADDSELRTVTGMLVDNPPDVVVACTGVGLRGWLEAAEGWGLAGPLRSVIDGARLFARGPQTADLPKGKVPEDPASAGECCDDVLTQLLRQGVAGKRIAVQLHGEPQPEFVSALRTAGADVVEVSVYRWVPPSDPTPLRRLVDLATSRLVDAITFTSAPSVGALLRVAGSDADALLEALRTDVLAACLGPVTAGPLVRRGVPASVPNRARLTSLVKLLVEELPKRAPTLRVAGQEVTLRGHAALVDGSLKPLAPAPMAVLRALAATPGRVLSRSALLAALPRSADEHAVEMAVARLRAALGGSSFVQTVAKRGYRLRVD